MMKAICKYDPCQPCSEPESDVLVCLGCMATRLHGLDDEIKEIQEAMR
jgi:hypothetical protein